MTFEEQSQLKTNANPNFVGAADPTSGSILQLPIDQPGITSIDTALEHYCASERVTFGQDHAQKRTRFLRLPKVLTIALGRFKRFEGDSVKLTKMIFAPALLTVPRSCLHQAIAEHKYVYRLTSFIHHSGTFAGGHYVSYNKGPDGKVQRSDDIAGPDRPSPEQTKRDKDTAYMYVYQLVDPEQLDPLDVRENDEERAKAKSDQPAGNIDSHGLPLPDAIVVAKRTQKSRRELFRVLNKEELSTNVAKEPTDPDIEPHQTAVLDGQVFLTDQPKGTRFTQVIRVKIDDLVFESGNKMGRRVRSPRRVRRTKRRDQRGPLGEHGGGLVRSAVSDHSAHRTRPRSSTSHVDASDHTRTEANPRTEVRGGSVFTGSEARTGCRLPAADGHLADQ